jgi:hypothetical protein
MGTPLVPPVRLRSPLTADERNYATVPTNLVPGDNSGNPDWRLIMMLNLTGALCPALYCRSWIPWVRAMATGVFLIVLVILVRIAAQSIMSGMPPLF